MERTERTGMTGTDQWSEAGPNGSLLARPLRIRPTMVG